MYDRDSWVLMSLNPLNRNLISVATQMALITLVATGWTVFTMWQQGWEDKDGSGICSGTAESLNSAYELMLIAVSFSLVFRLNRSATRHYEARQLCGWMVIHCRDLASYAAAFVPDAAARDALCACAVAFPVAFLTHFHGPAAFDEAALSAKLLGVLSRDELRTLAGAAHRPLCIIEQALAPPLWPRPLSSGPGPSPLALALALRPNHWPWPRPWPWPWPWPLPSSPGLGPTP